MAIGILLTQIAVPLTTIYTSSVVVNASHPKNEAGIHPSVFYNADAVTVTVSGGSHLTLTGGEATVSGPGGTRSVTLSKIQENVYQGRIPMDQFGRQGGIYKTTGTIQTSEGSYTLYFNDMNIDVNHASFNMEVSPYDKYLLETELGVDTFRSPLVQKVEYDVWPIEKKRLKEEDRKRPYNFAGDKLDRSERQGMVTYQGELSSERIRRGTSSSGNFGNVDAASAAEWAKTAPVTLLGDSLSVGLKGAGWDSTFAAGNSNAKVSRWLQYQPGGDLDGMGVLQGMVSGGQVKDILVINLGTNGGFNYSQLQNMIKLGLKKAKKVVLVTTNSNVGHRNEVQALMRRAASSHPKVDLIDWRAYSDQQGREKFYGGGDDIHLTDYGAYKDFIVSELFKIIGGSNEKQDSETHGEAETTEADLRYYYKAVFDFSDFSEIGKAYKETGQMSPTAGEGQPFSGSGNPLNADGYYPGILDQFDIENGGPEITGELIDRIHDAYHQSGGFDPSQSFLYRQGNNIVQTAKKYNMNPALFLMQATQETALGRVDCGGGKYNFGCIRATPNKTYPGTNRRVPHSGGWLAPETAEQGLEIWFDLIRSYIDSGIRNYKDYLNRYSPPDDGNNAELPFEKNAYAMLKALGGDAFGTSGAGPCGASGCDEDGWYRVQPRVTLTDGREVLLYAREFYVDNTPDQTNDLQDSSDVLSELNGVAEQYQDEPVNYMVKFLQNGSQGGETGLRQDEQLPAGEIGKLAILAYLLSPETNNISWDKTYPLTAAANRVSGAFTPSGGREVLKETREEGDPVSIRELVRLSVKHADSWATNMLLFIIQQNKFGSKNEANEFLNSIAPGVTLEGASGSMSPDQAASLMQFVANPTKRADDNTLRTMMSGMHREKSYVRGLLKATDWKGQGVDSLPSSVEHVTYFSGSHNHDVAIVNHPTKPFVVSIMSDGWSKDKISELAKELYDAVEMGLADGSENAAHISGSNPNKVFRGLPLQPANAMISYLYQDPRYQNHKGVDIVPKSGGNPGIHAVHKGTVESVTTGCADGGSSSCGGGWGNHVLIDHGVINGKHYKTRYAHLRQGTIKVSKGQKVRQGARLGAMGTSGNSTGVHLHFEVLENGERKDPGLYFDIKQISLAPGVSLSGRKY